MSITNIKSYTLHRGKRGHHYVPTKDTCLLKEAKDIQGIISGGYPNDNMVFDFSTPQSQAIKNGSSVISKGWCVRGALSPGLIN